MARVMLVLALVALASAVPTDLLGGRNLRFNPDTDTEYHLFTRANPSLSQRLLENREDVLSASNYDSTKRTVVLIHGGGSSILSDFNSVVVPAFLYAGDVNVIVVDWSSGASWGLNGYYFAPAIARVIQWLARVTGSSLADFHLVGHHDGAHMAGLISRQLSGEIGYITGLDPAYGWFYPDNIRATDGVYVEIIHTNAGEGGWMLPSGDVDFYPNGGVEQPGCSTTFCSKYRSFFFFAESLVSGGFIGRECDSYIEAVNSQCAGERKLEMGGLLPKTGEKGVFHLQTNAGPPFALGDN